MRQSPGPQIAFSSVVQSISMLLSMDTSSDQNVSMYS